VSSRYYRWRQHGIWDRVFADLQAQAETDGSLDWTIHFIDSTVVRAHQHAAGASVFVLPGATSPIHIKSVVYQM
jgi:transposase